jgi:uncharacterized short protein YbdD (DUF466 family)
MINRLYSWLRVETSATRIQAGISDLDSYLAHPNPLHTF